MPYRTGVISLVVRADRLGKTGVDEAGTLSLWVSTSLSLAAVVAFWLLWHGLLNSSIWTGNGIGTVYI